MRSQLMSIIGQLGPDDEFIVSDDSSTDDTLQVIAEVNDPRIKVLEGNQFFSPIFNFENALYHATGDVIFLSDQDNVWLDHNVEVMLNLLSNHDLVITDCEVIDENGQVLAESFFRSYDFGPGLIKNFVHNGYMGCCMAFNRRILEIALPFPKRIAMHDVWLGTIGAIFGRVYFCDEVLVRYRRHSANLIPLPGNSRNSLARKIGMRLGLLGCVAERIVSQRRELGIRGTGQGTVTRPQV